MNNELDWIDLVLPLGEQVETEQYEPTLEELVEFESN